MGNWLPTPTYDSSSDYTSSEDEEDDSPHNAMGPTTHLADEPENCLDSATDATVMATHHQIIRVTLDETWCIEEHLDRYEKVSLVYLLYEKPQEALQHCTKLLNGGTAAADPLLIRWWTVDQERQRRQWAEKLVEALAVIQNYQVLKLLGHGREDIRGRFLPHHAFISIHVNATRKALYTLCENLTEAETRRVLDMVFRDFALKKLHFNMFEAAYMELFLLHWETVGYIGEGNLDNLYSVLKQLEHFDLVDKLKDAVPQTQSTKSATKAIDSDKPTKKSAKIFERILGDESLLDLSTMAESLDTIAMARDGNSYHMDPENPGVCLIINQERFYTEIDPKYKDLLPPGGNKLEPRLGTDKDKQDLETTFKMFNFRTVPVDNLTHTEIVPKITEVMQSIRNESSLFICIMSHGDKGVIYGVNSCKVSVKKIQNLMCSLNRKYMSGKPKVLILQSCQGTRCQKISSEDEPLDDITTDSPHLSGGHVESVPPLADMFTFWATVPGYGAIRNKKTGTWFIQSLCEKMKELGNKEHFEVICTDVIGDVSSRKWDRKEDGVAAMVPKKDTTLRKRLYLPPIRR